MQSKPQVYDLILNGFIAEPESFFRKKKSDMVP